MPDVDVQQKVQDLEKELAVVATRGAAADATHNAAMDGQAATNAAAMAGQASTANASIAGLAASVVTGSAALVIGIFLGLAIRQAESRRRW
jgi:Tfp pilus assembly protein FimV